MRHLMLLQLCLRRFQWPCKNSPTRFDSETPASPRPRLSSVTAALITSLSVVPHLRLGVGLLVANFMLIVAVPPEQSLDVPVEVVILSLHLVSRQHLTHQALAVEENQVATALINANRITFVYGITFTTAFLRPY